MLYNKTNYSFATLTKCHVLKAMNSQVACSMSHTETSPPKVIWEECVTTPYDREWNRLLHVLLAVQYPLQTNPVTQPQDTASTRQSYIHPIC